jgi:DNA-binding NarL/FixJ family response regulator
MSKGMHIARRQTARILLVDDDPIVTATLSEGLLDAGYQISVQHNAAQAIHSYRAHPPDLAIVDIGLPDMTGTCLAANMLKHRHRPILILSSHSDKTNIDEAIESGVAGYLVKPLSTQQLIPSIDTALARFFEISLDVSSRLDETTPQGIPLDAVLDQFAVAVAIVEKDGKVLYENSNGRQLLDQNELLHHHDGRLYAHGHQKELLSLLIETVNGSSSPKALTLGDGRSQLNLFMSPLDNSDTALIFIIDPHKSSIAPERILRTLYNLTKKESQLAEHLLNGYTLEEYCARRYVTLNTVRSQLKAIYHKTDTNRQPELIRLLSRLFDNFDARAAENKAISVDL